MNIFEYASKCEANFEYFLNSVGKERKTTFYSDLSIAEWCGTNAVDDTYNRVMKSWGDDLEFMCEWVIALNQKIWQHNAGDLVLASLYDKLWREADEYCLNHFKGDDLTAYLDYVD
jgi:hypothetical protein